MKKRKSQTCENVHSKYFADLAERYARDPEYKLELLLLEITEAIYAAMESEGLSEGELAKRLAVSRRYVNLFLQGKLNASLRTLVGFAGALGRDVQVQIVEDPPPLRGTKERHMHYHVEYNYGHYSQKHRVETLAEAKDDVREEIERNIKCLQAALRHVDEGSWTRVVQGGWQVTYCGCTFPRCPSCDDPLWGKGETT